MCTGMHGEAWDASRCGGDWTWNGTSRSPSHDDCDAMPVGSRQPGPAPLASSGLCLTQRQVPVCGRHGVRAAGLAVAPCRCACSLHGQLWGLWSGSFLLVCTEHLLPPQCLQGLPWGCARSWGEDTQGSQCRVKGGWPLPLFLFFIFQLKQQQFIVSVWRLDVHNQSVSRGGSF